MTCSAISFGSSLLCSTHFPTRAASISAGFGLPGHQARARLFVQHGILASQPDALHSFTDILLVAGLWFWLVTYYTSSCLLPASAAKRRPVSRSCSIRWMSAWSGVCHSYLRYLLGLGASGPTADWRFQVTLFSGPQFSKHLEKDFLWVVPASRVAMDTSPLAHVFCSLLTF